MNKARLEAFSDGVIAIIITIMVLELKVPHGAELEDLKPLFPVFLSYVLSFIYVGIYWSNHHHLLQLVQKVNGPILWANLHLLFWLSMIPFATAWMGENHFPTLPVICYGLVLSACAISYFLLARVLVRYHPKDSKLVAAVGANRKEEASIGIYLTGVAFAFFVHSWVAYATFALVAVLWFVPDRRVERVLRE